MFLSSGLGDPGLVGGPVLEHGVDDVTATAGEAEHGGVVFLTFGSFAVVVGAAERVGTQHRKAGQEQCRLQPAVPASRRVLAPDRVP